MFPVKTLEAATCELDSYVSDKGVYFLQLLIFYIFKLNIVMISTEL